MPAAVLQKSSFRISAPRKDILAGIQTVGKAVASRSTTLPILTHVLIRQDAETGRVRLMATDLEMWIEHTLPAATGMNTQDGGAITVPARNFADLINALPDMEVELKEQVESGKPTLQVRCNRSNSKLIGLSPEDFPILPTVTENVGLTIDRCQLREAIRQVLFAVSTDASRFILTGVLFRYQGGKLKIVATDTHRLAVRECPITLGSDGDTEVVVPTKAMNELLRILGGNDDGPVTISISDKDIQFKAEDEKAGTATTLISRLIDGEFPNYERVVPVDSPTRITVETDAFLAALKRAAIFAHDQESANRVVLHAVRGDDGEYQLTIDALSDTFGKGHEEIDCGFKSETESSFQISLQCEVPARCPRSDG